MTPVLIVSYEAPPRLTAKAILTAKTLKALGETGAAPPRIDLVCASPGTEVPVDEALCALAPGNVQIHAVEPYPVGRTSILRRIIGGQGGWQKAAFSKCAALFPAEHKKPALLYSRSYPPVSHLVVLDLVEGPFQGVPWAAHFMEPWSQEGHYRTRAVLKDYVRRIAASASKLIFASEALRDFMLADFSPEVQAKACVVPPFHDPSLYDRANIPAGLEQDAQKKIAHVGTLHGLRSPQALFQGLAKAIQLQPDLASLLEVWLVGNAAPEFDGLEKASGPGVEGNVVRKPCLPYFQSLAAMEGADVLLAIGSDARNCVLLPSKLADYLGARKPLCAIAPQDSLTARLMKEWNQPCCACGDVEAIAALLRRVARGDLWAPPSAEVVQAHGVAAGKQLAGILAGLIADARPAHDGRADEKAQGQ